MHGDFRRRTSLFAQLGARIAELRKQQSIIQVEMAKALGVSQQIQHLPRAQQRSVMQVIDTVLARSRAAERG